MTSGVADQLSLIELLIPTEESEQVAQEPKGEPQLNVEPQPALLHNDELSSAADPGPASLEEDDPGYVPLLEPLTPVVTRSRKRKKTAEAQLAGSVVSIKIPADCTADEEQFFVDHFIKKFERTRAANGVNLASRAKKLAKEFGLPVPQSIRWVSNQKHQWGSCTPVDSSIRISDRLAGFPTWVIDYVIVHELAHLLIVDHSPEFWALVNAYPKTERARGYLLAKEDV